MENRGYIAMITVLIVLAVVTATAMTIALLSIGDAQSALAVNKGESMLQFMKGCAEDALFRSMKSSTFGNNTETLVYPEGTCEVTINKSSSPWAMTVAPVNTAFTRSYKILYTRSASGITLSSWVEQ